MTHPTKTNNPPARQRWVRSHSFTTHSSYIDPFILSLWSPLLGNWNRTTSYIDDSLLPLLKGALWTPPSIYFLSRAYSPCFNPIPVCRSGVLSASPLCFWLNCNGRQPLYLHPSIRAPSFLSMRKYARAKKLEHHLDLVLWVANDLCLYPLMLLSNSCPCLYCFLWWVHCWFSK